MSLNLYTYCFNDPLRFVDPTGHSAEDAEKAWLETLKQLWGSQEQGKGKDTTALTGLQKVIVSDIKEHYSGFDDALETLLFGDKGKYLMFTPEGTNVKVDLDAAAQPQTSDEKTRAEIKDLYFNLIIASLMEDADWSEAIMEEINKKDIPAEIKKLADVVKKPKSGMMSLLAQAYLVGMGFDLGNYGPLENGVDGDWGK